MTRPAVGGRMDTLLQELWKRDGTDLLLTVNAPPMVRVHGELTPLPDTSPLASWMVEGFLDELLTPEQMRLWVESKEFDFALDWRNVARVRGNVYTQRGSIAIALRVIPRAIPTMAGLGLPPVLSEFVRRHQGLILVTGPTGSGKSTTLASMLDQINTDRPCHILTVEDPIEYVHEHKRSAVSQREVGTDTASFADALHAALREDPDVLLVGEMRDVESIRIALTIAETGHLVLATLHTNDASQTITRIIDSFPPEQQAQVRTQLASTLTGVVYQRLLPRKGGGVVAAFEVLVANGAIRNLIKEGKTHQIRNCLVTGTKEGMVTFEQSLSGLVQSGVITIDDAMTRTLYPKEIELTPRAPVGVAR